MKAFCSSFYIYFKFFSIKRVDDKVIKISFIKRGGILFELYVSFGKKLLDSFFS